MRERECLAATHPVHNILWPLWSKKKDDKRNKNHEGRHEKADTLELFTPTR